VINSLLSGRQRPLTIAAACLVEARPSVLGISLLRYTAGAALCTVPVSMSNLWRAAAGALFFEFAVFFAYLFNGLSDVLEDRINSSRRPIARGVLPLPVARRVAWSSAAIALAGATWVGPAFGAETFAYILTGYLYSAGPTCLKRRPLGIAGAGTCLGLLGYAAGTSAVAGPAPTPPLIALAVFMSLWMGLVGAPAKDLPDAAGDAAAGRRTLAVVFDEACVRLVLTFSALALASCFLAVVIWLYPALCPAAVAMTTGAVALATVALTGAAEGTDRRRRRPYQIFMVTQYLVNITLICTV
jgi:4-hydroxybenzoate polyprenyltransferase